MKNVKWQLMVVMLVLATCISLAVAVKAENTSACWGFGCYLSSQKAGVLGDTITNCPPFDPQYCQSPGVVGKDANGCDFCNNQVNQSQPPQNNFPPCPSGQVYLCGSANPGPNMTCPNGGQPTCGVLTNNQPPQNNPGTIFCNSLQRMTTPDECRLADQQKSPQPQQPMTCPTPPANCPRWQSGSNGACGWCDYSNQQQQPTNQNPSGTFFCYSLNRQATAAECDAADKLKMNQPSCPPFNYCNGKVVRKDFNGVMCDVCDGSGQQNFKPNQNNQRPQPGNMQNPQNQEWNLVDAEENNNNQGSMFNWPDLYRQASQMKTEAAKVLKQVKKNDDLTKIINILNDYLKEIKAATTDEAKAALDEKYGDVDLYEEFNGYRETINNIRAKYDYERESLRISKEYNKAVKLIAKLKAPKYVKIDFAGIKSLLDDYGKSLQAAKDLVVSGDYEEARNTLMEANNESSPMDIYCVIQAAGDFDKNIALVKNATIRNSLLNDIVNPIFDGAETDLRGTCQFINNGNGNANTRNTIMTLINNARSVTKMSSSLNKKFLALQQKIDSFNVPDDNADIEAQ